MLKRVLAAICACVVLAGPASTGAHAEGAPFTQAQAERQLESALQAPSRGDALREATADLRDLKLALPKLSGDDARTAREILARPPQGNSNADPFGGDWPGNPDEEIVEQPTFIVHYPVYANCQANDEGCDEPRLFDYDSNGTPDYIDRVVESVEQSIQVENVELGWPYPKGDGTKGEPVGSSEIDRFDVYVADLCDGSDFNPCVYGYASPDDNSSECKSPPYKCFSYLVIDNDYREFDPDPDDELDLETISLQVTVAHEYNHVLQFNLDSKQDIWMFESTATWAEEKVFPDGNDWLFYMPPWAQSVFEPITSASGPNSIRIYGSAIWNHWIDKAYGEDVVRDAWELSRVVTPKDDAVASYDAAIQGAGGEGFAPEYVEFATGTAEWRTGADGLPDAEALPDVNRDGKLVRGRSAKRIPLDNTSFRLFNLRLRGADTVKLVVRPPGGGDWGIALIGRDGSAQAGTVERSVFTGDGTERRGVVTLADLGAFDRVTGVIVNSDDAKNNQRFRAAIR